MKAFVMQRHPDAPFTAPAAFTLVPASAYVPAGRPVFLPDWAGAWDAQPLLAIRVSRLGKAIAPGFAHRYYDAMAAGLMLIPRDLLSELHAASLPEGLTGAFDGCLQLGPWMPLPQRPVSVACGDSEITVTPEGLGADQAVALLSRYLTLKQGDVIAPLLFPLTRSVAPGSTLTVTVDGAEALTTRYK